MAADSPPRLHEAASILYPSEAVLNEEGLYVFSHEPDGELATQPPPASRSSSACYGASTALGDVYTPSIEDAPTEIHALIRAQQSRVPFNVILCRGASLSAFALPDECGCAYLGFFFISDVVASKSSCSWGENAEGPFVQGAMTWSFELNWTPGGDDPDALTVPSWLPWWMEDPSGPSTRGADHGPSEDVAMSNNMNISVQHPRWSDWMALHVVWEVERSAQSTSNGLAPLAIEDVRQFRGTDPITFPWNRHGEDVETSSSEGPEGLRRFTYKITDGAFVHHLFTRNHSTLQAQPTKLFYDLQAEVELEAEPVVKVARGVPLVSYGAQFGKPCKVKIPVKNGSGWPSDVPACVSRARDLMLRRARLSDDSSDVAISSLAVSSWRNPGNKKGLAFAAAQSPVVVLCLGADVELAFAPPRQAVARRAPKRNAPRSTLAVDEDDMDEDALPDIEHSERPSSRSTAKKATKGVRGERTDAALMITLVHGDLLVVQGAALEYSLKKTGMSIYSPPEDSENWLDATAGYVTDLDQYQIIDA
ncbi:hypothetical protein GSI_12751 [Ganoderma sinense ZZ0214-1]|uniref:Uncharacterized protein n=1 Tax=Ganoderma sinense ZZ0214-1 TaxID=1077348 RepID=A0A2G8RTQ7_9APHY|nr:hypothetical protein GSI_12751 [Ganoderma sinense ZZ0214-1]